MKNEETTANQTPTGPTTETTEEKTTKVRSSYCNICRVEKKHHNDASHTFQHRPRGFAAMDRDTVRAIATKGGIAAHKAGTAHKFTADEAREAGKKGGVAPHRSRGGRRGRAKIQP